LISPVKGSRSFGDSGKGPDFPQAVAVEGNAVSGVDETIEDGVSVGRVTDDVMPEIHRELTGNYGRTTTVTLFQDRKRCLVSGPRSRLDELLPEPFARTSS
jgi:hypothetical protein